MARGFNLTAEINLRGPANIRTVVADIRRQLGTVTANVNVRVNPGVDRAINNLNQALQRLNTNLQNTRTYSNQAVNALNSLATAGSKASTSTSSLPKNIQTASTAVNTLAKNTSSAAQATQVARTEFEEFGRQSALAVRRFAAFAFVTGAIFKVNNAIASGVKEFLVFNKELVRVSQVTGTSVTNLDFLESKITSLSTSFGVASQDLIKVSSTLAQAGLSARDTEKALKALALSAMAPSFDNLSDTVEGSIALMRQFDISAGDLEKALGSINSVAAKFAVEAGDIIAAIQRTGGVFAAASRGVSEGTDALNEFIAVFTSVRQTTRESAETIATGLRTIFTRIQRGDTIDALKEYGISLTDLQGKFVGPYEAVKRLAEGLNLLDPRDLRFSRITEELGGFRQIGKVIPLIQQFTVAQQALVVAQRGQGSLADDAAVAQQALAVKISKVKEEFTALIRSIGQSDSFQNFISLSLDLSSALIKIADSAKNVLPALTAIMAIRGASFLTQFATGFAGGLRKAQPPKKFASGGLVPGSGRGDKVPALLEPGEVVMSNIAANRYGRGNLVRMNKYARGGPVPTNSFEDAGNIERFAIGGQPRKRGIDWKNLSKGRGKKGVRGARSRVEPISSETYLKWKKGIDEDYDNDPSLVKINYQGRRVTPEQAIYEEEMYKYVWESGGAGLALGKDDKGIDVIGKFGRAKTKKPSKRGSEESRMALTQKLQAKLARSNAIGVGRSVVAGTLTREQQEVLTPETLQAISRSSSLASATTPRLKAEASSSADLSIKPKFISWGKGQGSFRDVVAGVEPKIRGALQGKQAEHFEKLLQAGSLSEYIKPENEGGAFGGKVGHIPPLKKAIYQIAGITEKNLGGMIQKFRRGGKANRLAVNTELVKKTPLIDDIPNATGTILPRPQIALSDIISSGGGAVDVDRTLKRTVGDQAYARAKTTEEKEAVLKKYFLDPKNRLDDIKSSRLTQFGKELQASIKSGKVNPSTLSIVSKSTRVPGVAEHLHKLFGIPVANMAFTSGGGKQNFMDALRTKGPRAQRVQRFAVGGEAQKTKDVAYYRNRPQVKEAMRKSGGSVRLFGLASLSGKVGKGSGFKKTLVAKPKNMDPVPVGIMVGSIDKKNATLAAGLDEQIKNRFGLSIDSTAKQLATMFNPDAQVKPNSSKAFREKVINNSGFQQVVGSVFEGALNMIGAPFFEKSEATKSMDFPFGLGAAASLFNIPGNIPTDATRTAGSAGKGPGTMIKQIERYLEGENKGLYSKQLQVIKSKGTASSTSSQIRKLSQNPQDKAAISAILSLNRGPAIPRGIKSNKVSDKYYTDTLPKNLENNPAALSQLETFLRSKTGSLPMGSPGSLPVVRRALGGEIKGISAASARAAILGKQLSGADMIKAARRAGYDIEELDDGMVQLSRNNQIMHTLNRAKASELLGSMATGYNVGGSVQRLAFGGAVGGRPEGPSFDQIRQQIIDKYPEIEFGIRKRKRGSGFGYNLTGALKSTGGLSGKDSVNFQQPTNLKQLQEYSDKLASKLMSPEKFALGGSSQNNVQALLTPGEAVIDPRLAKKIGKSKLDRMNHADKNQTKGYSRGGGVSIVPGSGNTDTYGPVPLEVGSYVIRKKATEALGFNKGGSVGRVHKFNRGGLAPGDSTVIITKVDDAISALFERIKQKAIELKKVAEESGKPITSSKALEGARRIELQKLNSGQVGVTSDPNSTKGRLEAQVSRAAARGLMDTTETSIEGKLAKQRFTERGKEQLIKTKQTFADQTVAGTINTSAKGTLDVGQRAQIIKKEAQASGNLITNTEALAKSRQIQSALETQLKSKLNTVKQSVQQSYQLELISIRNGVRSKERQNAAQEKQGSLLSQAMSRASAVYNKIRGPKNPGLTPEEKEIRDTKKRRTGEFLSRVGLGISFTAPMIANQVGQMMGGSTGAATEESVSSFSTFAGIGSQFGVIGTFIGLIAGGIAALEGWNRGLRKAENELSKAKIGQESEKTEKAIIKLEKDPRNQAITDSLINNLDTMSSEEASIQKRNAEMREPTYMGSIGAGLQTVASYATFGLVSEGRAGPPKLGTPESKKLTEEIGQTNAAQSKSRADAALKTLAAKGSSENLTIEQALESFGGNAAKIQEGIASGNVEYATQLEKLSQLAGIGAISASELEQRKKALIQKYYLQETESLKAAMADKARAMAANKVAKALNIAVTSIDRTFGNMEAALNRGSDALASTADKLEAISLDRASIQTSFGGQNILENPRAYSRAERRGAVSQAAGSFGPDMAFVERLSSVGNQIKDSLTSIGVRAQSAGTNKEQTAQEVQRTVDKQLEAAFGNNDLTRQLSQQVKIAIQDQLENKDTKELDIDKLLSESTGLTSIIEAEKKAFELLAQATKQATQAIDLYSSQVSKAVEMLNEADNISAEGTAMRASNDFRLREMFGQKIPVTERLTARREEAAVRAGVKPDQLNLNALLGQLQTLRQVRSDVESRKEKFQSGRDFTDPKTIEGLSKFNSTLISLNNQVDRTKNALKNLPKDIQGAMDDVAGAMQERLGRIESQRQAGSGLAEKLATSTPDELRDLNSTYNILSGALNGQVRIIQQSVVAQQAYQKTIQDGGTAMEAMSAAQNAFANENRQAFSMFSELIEVAGIEKPQANNMRADLLENMAKSQGMNMQNNPIFNKIIESLRQQPGEDPEIKRLETLYKQLQDTQQKAVDLSRKIVLEDSANLIRSAGEEVKKAIETARISFNEQQLNDIGLGLSRPVQVMGKSDGGMIYASTGKLINFQPKGTDTVPAMLTPGEFVVNARSTQQNLPLLQSINKSNGGPVQYFARGTSKPVSMSRNSTTSATTLEESRNIFDDIMRRYGSPVSESAAKPRPATTSAAKPRPAVAGAATPRPTTAVAPQTAAAAAAPKPAVTTAVAASKPVATSAAATSAATPRPAAAATAAPRSASAAPLDFGFDSMRLESPLETTQRVAREVGSDWANIPQVGGSRAVRQRAIRADFLQRLAEQNADIDTNSIRFKRPDLTQNPAANRFAQSSSKPSFLTRFLSSNQTSTQQPLSPMPNDFDVGSSPSSSSRATPKGSRTRILPTSATAGQTFAASAGDLGEDVVLLVKELKTKIGSRIGSATSHIGSTISSISSSVGGYFSNLSSFANAPYAGADAAESIPSKALRVLNRTLRGSGYVAGTAASGATRIAGGSNFGGGLATAATGMAVDYALGSLGASEGVRNAASTAIDVGSTVQQGTQIGMGAAAAARIAAEMAIQSGYEVGSAIYDTPAYIDRKQKEGDDQQQARNDYGLVAGVGSNIGGNIFGTDASIYRPSTLIPGRGIPAAFGRVAVATGDTFKDRQRAADSTKAVEAKQTEMNARYEMKMPDGRTRTLGVSGNFWVRRKAQLEADYKENKITEDEYNRLNKNLEDDRNAVDVTKFAINGIFSPTSTRRMSASNEDLDFAANQETTRLQTERKNRREKEAQQQKEEKRERAARIWSLASEAASSVGTSASSAVNSGVSAALSFGSSIWNQATAGAQRNRDTSFKTLYDNASRLMTRKPRLPGQIEEFKTLGLERTKLEQELAEMDFGAPGRIGLTNDQARQKTDEIKSRISDINNKIVDTHKKSMTVAPEEADKQWKKYDQEKQAIAIKAEKKERGLAIRKQAAIDSSLESVTRMRVPKDPEKLAGWRSKALEKIRQKFYLSGDPSSDIKMMTAYGLSPDLASNLFRPMNEQQNEAVYDLLSQQTKGGREYKYSDQDLQLLRLSRKEIIQRVTEGKVARPQDLIKRKEQLETAREKEFGKATKAIGRIDSLAQRGMKAQNPRVQENFRKNLKKKLIKSGYIDPRENAATNAQRLSALGAQTVSFIYPNQTGGMLAQAKSSGGMIYASAGQLINFQPKGSDTVPAMLTPGEFVVNSRATKQNLPMLQAINKADGGFIGAAEPTQVSQNIRDKVSSDIIQKQTLMKLEGVNRKTSNIDSTTKDISNEKLPTLANSANLYTKQSSSTLNSLSKQSSEINKNTKETAQVLNPIKRSMGGPVYASKGTLVPYQPRGTDTVPAMLTPGEFVVNRAATQQNLPLLRSINSGSVGGYSKGGVVYLEEGGMAGLSERELFLARLEEEQNRKNKLTTQTDTRTGRITRKDAKSGTVMEDSLSAYNKDIGSSDPFKAFGIGAAKGVGPTAAGISAGAYATAATAPFLGPFAPLAGLGAGITAGMITAFLQEKGLDSLAPEANAEMKRITDENQIASTLGSALPGMGAGIAQQGLASFAGTLGQRFGSGAISATMGSALEYGATGKVDPSNLGINFGTGFAQPMGGKRLRASTESGSSGVSSALLKGNVLSTSPSPQRGPTPLSKLSVATKATQLKENALRKGPPPPPPAPPRPLAVPQSRPTALSAEQLRYQEFMAKQAELSAPLEGTTRLFRVGETATNYVPPKTVRHWGQEIPYEQYRAQMKNPQESGSNPHGAAGRWATDAPHELDFYINDNALDAPIYYFDVPNADQYNVSRTPFLKNSANPTREFVLPDEMLRAGKRLMPQQPPQRGAKDVNAFHGASSKIIGTPRGEGMLGEGFYVGLPSKGSDGSDTPKNYLEMGLSRVLTANKAIDKKHFTRGSLTQEQVEKSGFSGGLYPVKILGGIDDFLPADQTLADNPAALAKIEALYQSFELPKTKLGPLKYSQDFTGKVTGSQSQEPLDLATSTAMEAYDIIHQKLASRYEGQFANSPDPRGEALRFAQTEMRKRFVEYGIPGITDLEGKRNQGSIASIFDESRIQLGEPHIPEEFFSKAKAYRRGGIAYLKDGGVAADIGWTRVNARQASETRKEAILQAKTRLQNLHKINSEIYPSGRFNVDGLNAFLSAIEANQQDFKFYNDDQFKIPSSDYDDIITDNLTTPYEKAQKLYDKNIGRKNELQNITRNIRGINLKKPSDAEENTMFTPQLSWAKVYEIKEAQIKAAEQELDQRSEYIKRATEAARNHNPANNERKEGEPDPWSGVFGYSDGGIVNSRINRLRANAELPNARTSADRLRANAELPNARTSADRLRANAELPNARTSADRLRANAELPNARTSADRLRANAELPNAKVRTRADRFLGPSPSEIYLQRGVLDKKERPLSRSQALEQLSQFNNKELYSKLSPQEELKKKELEAITQSKSIKFSGYQTGGVVYANKGKMINFQPRGTDTVPAMLTPGEFVVNRSATQANLPLLQGINGGATGFSAGGQVNYMADGGLLGQMFKPVMRSFTSLTSSIANTIQALQTYQKQLAGTQPNSVSNTSGRNINLDGLSVFTNKFDQFIVALNKINIPPMVQLQVAPVTVNITGAEALVQALQGPMSEMLQSQIAQSFARLSASTEGAIQV